MVLYQYLNTKFSQGSVMTR